MGIADRYWGPISPAEAADVLGRPVEIVSQHLRWLFAVARCRWDGGEAIVKRQPPMRRSLDDLRWQHRLANHVADRGVPAVRCRGLVVREGLWYEVYDVAQGDDAYAGVDTWEPFRRVEHVAEAGRVLAAFHDAGREFQPRSARPQAGFVVQLGAVRFGPVEAVRRLAVQRPAVAEYLGGVDWHDDTEAAYGGLFAVLRGRLAGLPARPLHGDWQTNNLFFDGDRISSIIDFHQADFGPRALDLAVALERNCFFWNRISEGEDDALDLGHARVLIEAYHEGSALTAEERDLLPRILAASQFEYGISFLDYYWGVEHDREKADWAWHTYVIGHARWWQTAAGLCAREVLEDVCRSLG